MGFGDSKGGMHSWTLDEEKTREVIKHALDLGINFFDTALAYAGGTSEQYLGRALKDFAKREDVVIATKFLPMPQEVRDNGISVKKYINDCLNSSLNNLGVEYIDLYIYHCYDEKMPIEEIMETLNEAVMAGKVKYIGISNCFAWQIAKMVCWICLYFSPPFQSTRTARYSSHRRSGCHRPATPQCSSQCIRDRRCRCRSACSVCIFRRSSFVLLSSTGFLFLYILIITLLVAKVKFFPKKFCQKGT